MHIIRPILTLLILTMAVTDARSLRKRRQALANQFTQDVSNLWSNTYNNIRDNVGPMINSAVDRFSQNWDGYKQGINQGINQIGQTWNQYKPELSQNWDRYRQNLNQGWNQFRQNINPSYPQNTNYGYNQYPYNPPQYGYPMNNNNPYYDSRAQNGYGSGWYGQPGMNNQYDLNIVRQPTSNFGYNGNQGYGRRRR